MKKLVPLTSLLLLSVACTDVPTEPTPTAVSDALLSGHAAGVVATARGSGHITDLRGRERKFAFNASMRSDGSVNGEINLVIAESDLHILADVVCLRVDGDVAWVGGTAKEFSFYGPTDVAFMVQDNGEGAGATDMMTLMWTNAPDGFAETFCETGEPQVPSGLLPVRNGNIQVSG